MIKFGKRLLHRYVSLLVNTSRSFPHSWLITGFVTRLTRRVPLVEEELLTLPEHLSSPSLSDVRVTRSLVLCVCFVDHCLSFCTFFLPIVLSVLQYIDSDCPFGIYKLFLRKLKSYGVDSKLLYWVSRYLQDRQQRVVIHDVPSTPYNVSAGVPQWSVLGPLLFIVDMYIKDMAENIISLGRSRLEKAGQIVKEMVDVFNPKKKQK